LFINRSSEQSAAGRPDISELRKAAKRTFASMRRRAAVLFAGRSARGTGAATPFPRDFIEVRRIRIDMIGEAALAHRYQSLLIEHLRRAVRHGQGKADARGDGETADRSCKDIKMAIVLPGDGD